jgi:hypothetical protein
MVTENKDSGEIESITKMEEEPQQPKDSERSELERKIK